MPMVRPMSGLAAVLQTWPLGDSIGVRQQYPTVKQDTLLWINAPVLNRVDDAINRQDVCRGTQTRVLPLG